MGLLDFIKNRNAQQPSATPAPQQETAKQMYAREAVQEKAGQKAIALSPEGVSAAKEAGDLFRQGTQPKSPEQSAPAPAPQDGATAPQPMAQLSMSQDKAAPALSPTSAQQGSRSNEQEKSPAPSDTPGKAQQEAKRTLPRATPSWER